MSWSEPVTQAGASLDLGGGVVDAGFPAGSELEVHPVIDVTVTRAQNERMQEARRPPILLPYRYRASCGRSYRALPGIWNFALEGIVSAIDTSRMHAVSSIPIWSSRALNLVAAALDSSHIIVPPRTYAPI